LSISWTSWGEGPIWRLEKDSSGGSTSFSLSWRTCADREKGRLRFGAEKNLGSLLDARKASIVLKRPGRLEGTVVLGAARQR